METQKSIQKICKAISASSRIGLDDLMAATGLDAGEIMKATLNPIRIEGAIKKEHSYCDSLGHLVEPPTFFCNDCWRVIPEDEVSLVAGFNLLIESFFVLDAEEGEPFEEDKEPSDHSDLIDMKTQNSYPS